MTNKLSFPVVIPAAGIGSRMSASQAKQYLTIRNKMVIEHTIERFLNQTNICLIVVVLHPEDRIFETLSIAKHTKIKTVIGGKERVNSVLAGLRYLAKAGFAEQFVLVHDAARPCIEQKDINKLIEGLLQSQSKDSQVSGAILACPVADTIKKSMSADEETDLSAAELCEVKNNVKTQFIQSTVDRDGLWQAQTPQMFKVNELIGAIETGINRGNSITDESSAMEYLGKAVLLVEGPSSNLKITRPSDLSLAAFYLSNDARS